MLRVRGPSVASRGGGEADLKDDRSSANEERLLLICDAKEVVVDLTGTPRATGAKNSKRFQSSGLSPSRAELMVEDRTSAASIRADFGIHFGMLEETRRLPSRRRTSLTSVGNGSAWRGGAEDVSGRHDRHCHCEIEDEYRWVNLTHERWWYSSQEEQALPSFLSLIMWHIAHMRLRFL